MNGQNDLQQIEMASAEIKGRDDNNENFFFFLSRGGSFCAYINLLGKNGKQYLISLILNQVMPLELALTEAEEWKFKNDSVESELFTTDIVLVG